MNPNTLKLALTIAQQLRKSQKNRAQRRQLAEFDALRDQRNVTLTDEQQQAVLADSPAHIRAVAEEMRKQDGAAEALAKARALHAAHEESTALAEGNSPATQFDNPLAKSAKKARKAAKRNSLRGRTSQGISDLKNEKNELKEKGMANATDAFNQLGDRAEELFEDGKKKQKKLAKQAKKDSKKARKAAKKNSKDLRSNLQNVADDARNLVEDLGDKKKQRELASSVAGAFAAGRAGARAAADELWEGATHAAESAREAAQ